MHYSGEQLSRPIDFAIVGAPKGGTTSLSQAISATENGIILDPKDAFFFQYRDRMPQYQGPEAESLNRRILAAQASYPRQLAAASKSCRVGDAMVNYMYEDYALNQLAAALAPDGQIIVCLRRPDHRAYSAFMHKVRDGVENLDFTSALVAKQSRREKGWMEIWRYRALGFYSSPVERLFDIFGRTRVHVLMYEELIEIGTAVLPQIFSDLGLSTARGQTLPHANKSGVIRRPAIQRVLRSQGLAKRSARRVVPRSMRETARNFIQEKSLSDSTIPAQAQRQLIADYTADIRRLSRLLNRDLSHWLQV